MRKRRRQFTAQYKVETVLEALRGEKTAAQICREYQLSEDLLSRWKQEFLRRAPEIFETRKGASEGNPPQAQIDENERMRIDELERTVRHLLVEVDVLKKRIEQKALSLGEYGSPARHVELMAQRD